MNETRGEQKGADLASRPELQFHLRRITDCCEEVNEMKKIKKSEDTAAKLQMAQLAMFQGQSQGVMTMYQGQSHTHGHDRGQSYRPGRRNSKTSKECFVCGKLGHFTYDYRQNRENKEKGGD